MYHISATTMKTYMKTILRTVLLAVLPVIASCKAGGNGPAGKTSVADVEHFVDSVMASAGNPTVDGWIENYEKVSGMLADIPADSVPDTVWASEKLQQIVDGLMHFMDNADLAMLPNNCDRHLKTMAGKIQKLDSIYIDMSEDEWEETMDGFFLSIPENVSDMADFAAVQIIANHLFALDGMYDSVQYERRLDKMQALMEQMDADTFLGNHQGEVIMNITMTSDRTVNGVVVESDTLRYSSGE